MKACCQSGTQSIETFLKKTEIRGGPNLLFPDSREMVTFLNFPCIGISLDFSLEMLEVNLEPGTL